MHTRTAFLWLLLAFYGFYALPAGARDLFIADIEVENQSVF